MFCVRFCVLGSVVLGSAVLGSGVPGSAQAPDPATRSGTAPLLVRVGEYVERYYARAQRVLAIEKVTVQPLARDLTFDGFPRRLTYELRVEWDPAADGGPAATVVRELVAVNGRPPRPDDEPECTDPRGVSPEPLRFLLPDERGKYIFHPGGETEVDDVPAVTFEFRSVRAEPPRVEWNDDCASIDLPGRTRGRIWVDPETAEILRFDEHLVGLVDIPVPRDQQRRGAARVMTVERADMSIRYRPVSFSQPDETLMLPSQIESLVVVRNSGQPQLRITQRFSDYRRFVTSSRIVR